MGRKAKTTDNQIVAEWLIQNRWRDSISDGTKQRMPSFVEEAVYAAVYIVAGVSNGKVNISPKLIFKTLMLSEITSQTVKNCEIGYEMTDRTARRLAQCSRFALNAISRRVQECEANWTEEEKMNWKLEKDFIESYYNKTKSDLHSPPTPKIPEHILSLYRDKKYLEYGRAVMDFRSNK